MGDVVSRRIPSEKTGPISLAEITKMLRHHTPGQPLSDEKVIEIIKEVEAQIAKDEDLSLIHISEPTRPY